MNKITFRDHYKANCILQRFNKKTIELGVPNGLNFHNGKRWEVSRDKTQNVYSTMILNQKQVQRILPLLTQFAETGTF